MRLIATVGSVVAKKTINDEQIAKVTASLPPERANTVANVLKKYRGKTWSEALDEHSKKKREKTR
jgi:hypothetical protein